MTTLSILRGIKSLQNVLQKDDFSHIITKFDISKINQDESLKYAYDVWLVAPEEEQSAKSHSFTMRQPLFIKNYSDREITLRGTPADCVYFALTHFITTLGDAVYIGLGGLRNQSWFKSWY